MPASEDIPSFEFEFSEQSLPDVYKLITESKDSTEHAKSDDWVLFADISTALSVKTADALVKLLNDENAVVAMPADHFNEYAMSQKILGQQPFTQTTVKSSVAKSSIAVTEQSLVKDASAETVDIGAAPEESITSVSGKQILLVRYDLKLKQLLGVDTYTMS